MLESHWRLTESEGEELLELRDSLLSSPLTHTLFPIISLCLAADMPGFIISCWRFPQIIEDSHQQILIHVLQLLWPKCKTYSLHLKTQPRKKKKRSSQRRWETGDLKNERGPSRELCHGNQSRTELQGGGNGQRHQTAHGKVLYSIINTKKLKSCLSVHLILQVCKHHITSLSWNFGAPVLSHEFG